MPEVISLDQQRAAYAWQCVSRHGNQDYERLAKSAPALIMNNGLMSTLAFYQGKGKAHHEKLLKDVLGWLEKQGIAPAGYRAAMEELHDMDASAYRHASMEALEIIKWIRQLAPTVKGGADA